MRSFIGSWRMFWMGMALAALFFVAGGMAHSLEHAKNHASTVTSAKE